MRGVDLGGVHCQKSVLGLVVGRVGHRGVSPGVTVVQQEGSDGWRELMRAKDVGSVVSMTTINRNSIMRVDHGLFFGRDGWGVGGVILVGLPEVEA